MECGSKQSAWGETNGSYTQILMPNADTEVVPGVLWGLPEEIFSPAFWKYQSQLKREKGEHCDYQLGRTLLEEVSVCLLGGYGMPAELGLAAFHRLRDEGLLDGFATRSEIKSALSRPFQIKGRARKYRFISQKAEYLSSALSQLRDVTLSEDHRASRDYLTTIKGIGPKTASWVIRNYLGSDDVAILDVHIVRAGVTAGLFKMNANPSTSYYQLEEKFLSFCQALDEPASLLDSIMWDFMRRIGPACKKSRKTTA